MVASKTELFDEALVEQARYFKALAHPARLAILNYLAETRTCISGDITDELPLSRTTVGQHLKELKDAGLIQGQVEGVKTNYCLDPVQFNRFINLVNAFFQELNLPEDSQCC